MKTNEKNTIEVIENDVLNKTVSYYSSCRATTGTEKTIESIIQEIKTGIHSRQVSKIRTEIDKKKREALKQALPSITVSGIFKGSHKAENIQNHSGLIQVDFDHVKDLGDTRLKLEKDDYTFCLFISPSGTGIKLMVQIPTEIENHVYYFESLREYYLKTYGLQIDEKCKDLSRLMFLSSDESIFTNIESQVFTHKTINKESENSLQFTEIGKQAKTYVKHSVNNDYKASLQDIETVVKRIENKKFDITNGYENWLSIGFSFSHELGESGRDYFHRISRFNPEYDTEKCNRQFDECLKDRGANKITISTFFGIAKNSGVDITPEKETGKQKYNPIAPVAEFLTERYDLRFNENTLSIDVKLKEENTFKEANLNDFLIELMEHGVKCSDKLLKTFLGSNRIEKFNPFKAYFESLKKWNAKNDIDHIRKLCSYVKAKEPDRFYRMMKKALVRNVVCSINESYFNKQAVILISPKQNIGKSSFVRWLCPEPLKNYYTEHFTFDKDGMISLFQNFIINIDELASLNKQDITKIKQHLSAQTVKVRPPYKEKAELFYRRCSFWGTTNELSFLNDLTGTVRWLCFEIDEINWKYQTEIDINDIWAQAYWMFKEGFQYDLSKEEIKESEMFNSKYQQPNPAKEIITKLFIPTSKDDSQGHFKTATEIAHYISGLYPETRITAVSIGMVMQSLGFEKNAIRRNNQPIQGYFLKEVMNVKDEN